MILFSDVGVDYCLGLLLLNLSVHTLDSARCAVGKMAIVSSLYFDIKSITLEQFFLENLLSLLFLSSDRSEASHLN